MVPDRLMPNCDQQTTNLLVSEFCDVLNNIDLKKLILLLSLSKLMKIKTLKERKK